MGGVVARAGRCGGGRMFDGLAEVCGEALEEHGCPSVSVAVARDGKVEFAAAYGAAPAGTETVYALASVTKPMTAAAVCVAADEGLLDLDAPVPGAYRFPAPSVRQLLQHRGGFPKHYDFWYGVDGPRVDGSRYAVPYREPGGAFEYSNLGYQKAADVLEAATGRPFGAYLRERVFAPLGMARAHFGPAGPSGGAAPRHAADGRVYPEICDSSHPASGHAWATAAETALFGLSFERLLKPETAAAVRVAPATDPCFGYGLGWSVSTDAGGPLVMTHDGWMGGVATILIVAPEQRLALAVLTNSTSTAARKAVARHLMDALLPGRRTQLNPPPADGPDRAPDLPEGSWAGTVDTPEGPIPLRLRIAEDATAEIELDGRTARAEATTPASSLHLTAPLQLPTADARINSPLTSLELQHRDGGWSGLHRAHPEGDTGHWFGNLLTHHCTLHPLCP